MRSMSASTSCERVELGQHDLPVVHAAEQGVGDRIRLLADLLLHEARPAALLGGGGVPGDVELAGRHGVPAKSMTSTESGRIVTISSWPISIARRVCSTNAATSEPRKFSPSPRPIDERRVAAGADHDAGLVLVHHEQGECALQARDGRAHRLGQVAGLAEGAPTSSAATSVSVSLVKVPPASSTSCLSGGEVLDDPVVDQRELAVVAEVRMRVDVGRAAVGRPAGVADAGVAVGERSRRDRSTSMPSLPALLARPELARRRRAPRRPPSRSRGTRGA